MVDTSSGGVLDGGVVDMPAPHTNERPVKAANGFAMLGVATLIGLAGVALLVLGIALLAGGSVAAGLAALIAGVLAIVIGFVMLFGLTAVAPGEARVVQLLGRYVGTLRTPGFQWVNPITVRRRVSTRIRNHETDVTKVNDADGNPIQIATVVVWQVQDTAQAVFEVDDFVEFVAIQAETAVRHIAGSYPYDAHGEPRLSLRDNADEINDQLSTEIAARVASAGVKVIESRIIHLAYAPEIAHAMLRRQQAGAVVAARQRIVEGAVGMVEMALAKLAEHDVVELDEERKAAMVSNLLVVLVGDRDTQPVVNTGTLYQ
ncbi:SPFH domain-containing protein [Nonomuraea rubra]|uniref:Regulator of protease activity HflC (Stomatin/prohibitin superfamily) n=1 Tax=Nonomuraea rubra TaxID=46180 RepID=A0A7X0NNN8_9ACTN|nr:SPFH domain-containing protein [Nonomuraea rubra]MBB6546757.1 regulator of protease activity HflC (stomatin/prohibitin superfamily) [Nonomuraea rubra]